MRYATIGVGAAMVLLIACEQKSSGSAAPAKKDPLKEVSVDLTLMEIHIQVGKETNCLFKERFPPGEDQRAAASACDFFTVASEKTAPVFQAIRESGKLPVGDHFFFRMVEVDSDEESPATVSQVGLFRSAADCDALEQRVRREGLFPTTRCKKWSGNAGPPAASSEGTGPAAGGRRVTLTSKDGTLTLTYSCDHFERQAHSREQIALVMQNVPSTVPRLREINDIAAIATLSAAVRQHDVGRVEALIAEQRCAAR